MCNSERNNLKLSFFWILLRVLLFKNIAKVAKKTIKIAPLRVIK